MTRMALVSAAIVLAVAVAGLGGTAGYSAPGHTGTAPAAKASRLVPFRSCGDLLGYVTSQAAPLVGPWGFGGPSFARGGLPPGVAVPAAGSAPAGATPQEGVDYSGTNVQEQGVDEPDLVKTNGTTLFAVAAGRLNAVAVTGTRPQLLDSLKLDGGWSHELLLAGDRLLVLSRGGYWVTPRPAATAIAMPYFPAKSVLSEIDVSNPRALRLVRTLTGGRRLRRCAPRRRDRTHRRLLSGADNAVVRAAGRVDGRGARDGARPQPGCRPVIRPQLVAPDVPHQARGPAGAGRAAARPVPERRPPTELLRPRDADGAHP